MASPAQVARAFALGAFGGISGVRAAFEMSRGEWTDAAFTVAVAVLGLVAMSPPGRNRADRR